MLYFNRCRNESTYIIDNKTKQEIEVVILDIQDNVVQLGFVDPDNNYTILRKEVKQRQENHELPNPFFKDRIPARYKRYRDEQNAKLTMDDLNKYLSESKEAA